MGLLLQIRHRWRARRSAKPSAASSSCASKSLHFWSPNALPPKYHRSSPPHALQWLSFLLLSLFRLQPLVLLLSCRPHFYRRLLLILNVPERQSAYNPVATAGPWDSGVAEHPGLKSRPTSMSVIMDKQKKQDRRRERSMIKEEKKAKNEDMASLKKRTSG